MNAIRQLLLFTCCVIALNGCGSFKQMVSTLFPDPLHEVYRKKAVQHENAQEPQQALFAWRVAARLNPDDKTIPDQIKILEERILKSANEHYKRGVDDYHNGRLSSARSHFLIALRIMPNHKGALKYLKTRLPNSENPVYNVVRGDSYSKIASDVYNDAAKASIIAYFNDLDPQKPLLIGTDLMLPELSPKVTSPRNDLEDLVQRAKSALENRRYREVLKIASEIDQRQPHHPAANDLRDAVFFQRGMALLEQRKYVPAMAQLKKVSPQYPGRAKAIDRIRKHLTAEATVAELAQAQHFLDEKSYAEAIIICEEILTQDPFNKKAKAIFNASHYAWGKMLLEEGKEAEAITTLNALDQGYQDTAQLLAQARAQLNARSESLYRKGVRLFLNEELEKAIGAWEQTLELNPDHPKAKQDIENAIRLLDKWRDLDQKEDTTAPLQ